MVDCLDGRKVCIFHILPAARASGTIADLMSVAALNHLVIMNTWGFINSFGVFQTYYVTALNRPPSDISWVGSMQVFFLFFVGTFTGRLTDAGYFRPVFLLGSFLGVFGIFMASLSTTYWQLFLAQGVCMGLGNGCLFCPSLSLLSTYFSKKRGLALGIGAAGSATGGMIYPAMVQQLLPRVGFAWTMRSLGFIQLACLILCNIGIKPRLPPRRTGALVDWKSFKELPYVLFAIGMFFVSSLCWDYLMGADRVGFLGRVFRILLYRLVRSIDNWCPVQGIHQPVDRAEWSWCDRSHHPWLYC